MIMNGYERQLVDRLRYHMSKREAEEALGIIRRGLDEDGGQIRPVNFVDSFTGKITKEYPPFKKVIWAFFNDRFDVFEKEND